MTELHQPVKTAAFRSYVVLPEGVSRDEVDFDFTDSCAWFLTLTLFVKECAIIFYNMVFYAPVVL